MNSCKQELKILIGKNIIEELLKKGHYVGELYYLRKDKTYLPVDRNIKSFTNENGEITSILTSIHDITKTNIER